MMIRVSTKSNRSSGPGSPNTDAQNIEWSDITPHPPGDQVDRSVVLGHGIKQAATWALRLIILGVFIYLLGRILGRFWAGVLPITFALIICTVLAPISTRLRKSGLPSSLAALLTLSGFVGLVGATIFFIAPDFARQSQGLYLQTVEGIQRVQVWLQGPPLHLNSEDLSNFIDEVFTWMQDQADTIVGGVFAGIETATSMIITLFVVLVLTFFFLKDGHKFLPWLRRATGRRSGWHMTELFTRAWLTLGGFIRAQALVSLIDAVFIGLGLVIIGVPLALALAIITFMAGFIPFAGAITAGALSTLIALVSLGFTEAIMVLIVVVAVQQIESNILSPWFQARAMNLHPVVVLISVITGAALFNLIGAFLAVPVAAMVAVCYRYAQDILTLESGERRARDITSVTIAGELAAQFTEDNGRGLRRTWRQDGSSQPQAHEDAAKYTKEATIHLDEDLEDQLEKRIDLDARPDNKTTRHEHRLATERFARWFSQFSVSTPSHDEQSAAEGSSQEKSHCEEASQRETSERDEH